jgi:hydrogenase maturation protein HypF
MMETGLNAPSASSAGRLFDAAAAIIGIHPERVSYEGQAAIELEALAATATDEAGDGYCGEIIPGSIETLSWAPMWRAMLVDVASGGDRALIAARFQAGIASTVATTATRLAERHGLATVVLSGGVFQNRLLTEQVSSRLREAGIHVLAPARLPANDGGIALGQCVIAALAGGASAF